MAEWSGEKGFVYAKRTRGKDSPHIELRKIQKKDLRIVLLANCGNLFYQWILRPLQIELNGGC